jgi:hypothetical protein
MASHEKDNYSVENKAEFDKGELEKARERLKENIEKGHEKQLENAEKRAERARFEANKEALKTEESGRAERKSRQPIHTPASKKERQKQKDKRYQKTLQDIQKDMKVPSRTFSKIIHNPAVEKTSEVVGSTIARPNSILAGSLAALILTGIVYLVANNYGYELSGFEFIGAFIIGWALGLIIDYVRVGITGRRSL